MTIILFLIDTSASMCQKAHVNGVQKTYLDIAKGAVETFLKYRQRSQDCMGDRYMLLTFEDPPCNVKAGWKENHATFMNELKNLQSNGLTSMGEALKNAFDLLNLNRMQSGIDTYGQGRCPFYLEPSVIIVITDGGKYSFRNGIQQDIILNLHAQIQKFSKEPFRWDQRLFSLVLRMTGNKIDERVDGKVPHDDSPIEKMCEVTGGRSYRIKSQYVLNQCIESLVQKVQPGVVVHFEQATKDIKDGEYQEIFPTTKKMIYVHKHPSQKTFPVGFWPIPESYLPDQKLMTLPPRDAHPKIKIMTPCVDEPQIVRNFPVDKYELEASPLTLQILSKREPTKCWPVCIHTNSNGGDMGMSMAMPFGYLKANNTFTQVYLMVLPYNYMALLPLLNDFFQKHNQNPPSEWIFKFSNYVRSIPQYYYPFLRRALVSINVPFPLLQYLLPESIDVYLSPAVANCLKQMKTTAKLDQEALCLRVFKQLKLPKPPYHPIETTKLQSGQPLKRDLVTHPMLKETFNKLHNEINTYDNYTIVVPTVHNTITNKNYRNPFDIPRRDLIDEISRMRENFFRMPTGTGVNLYAKDAGHSLPIAEMGNYQEYLKNKEPPLREIEPTNVRQHMFGNPYKKDKHMVMVDEADLGDVAPMRSLNAQNTPKKLEMNKITRKRKAGPIRKDFIFRRTSTSSREGVSPNQFRDTDDESSESGSSYLDDGDENRLVVDFVDFNEPPNEDFSINGHVQDFINGDIEDSDEANIPALPGIPVQPLHMQPPIILNNSPQIQPVVNVVNSGHVLQPVPSNLPPPPMIQNDINDAQEISKILQQCHNGTSSNNIDHNTKNSNINSNNHSVVLEKTEVIVKDEIPNENNHNSIQSSIIHENGKETKNGGSGGGNGDEEISDEMKENIKQENLKIRTIVFNDIRKPGRDYSILLDHLNLFQGDFGTRFNCIQMCINESLRFRRRKMADSIQDWWERQIDKLST